ncbi:MAG TPA: tetratricopeptide repeat protein [Xanthobacteraceae bacterium]|nr:tetratricopeptide repeat protein [Xanthobacteraceae bacterium]
MSLDTLLTQPANKETGEALLRWVEDLRGRVLAGEMMIGILSEREVARAPQALERAIGCGADEAWIALADWYASPPYGEPDLVAAPATLRRAIAMNVNGARLRLAEMQWYYRRAEASPTEQTEAYTTAQSLAEADPGNAAALYLQGLLLHQGFGVVADPAGAAQLQCKAAALAHAPAMFEAYIHYETGSGVARDSVRAFRYLQDAADAGHPRALYNLGACYATGRGVSKDFAVAADWYRKAAKAGNPRAMATLGAMYAAGQGVEQNLERAAQLFDEAEYMGLDVSHLREGVGL